jgi:hypothetical protein
MFDQDILDENKTILSRRYRALQEVRDVDIGLLGLTLKAAQELTLLSPHQVDRAADSAAPLFGFMLEDQIIQTLQSPLAIPLVKLSHLEAEVQEDTLLMLTNRWTSCRHSEAYAGTVLGLSRRMIQAFSAATYADVRRISVLGGLRPRMCVRHQYLFHAGRNLTMHTGQRTNLAVSNARFNSF